jgi:hypothetical protein
MQSPSHSSSRKRETCQIVRKFAAGSKAVRWYIPCSSFGLNTRAVCFVGWHPPDLWFSFQENKAVHSSNFLSPGSTKNNTSEVESLVTPSSRHANRSDSRRRRRNISRRISGMQSMQSRRDLREAVERRFMRMTQAHDRIRTELLASHSLNMK